MAQDGKSRSSGSASAAWCAPLRAREGAGDGAEPHDGVRASKARAVRLSGLSGAPPRFLPAKRGSASVEKAGSEMGAALRKRGVVSAAGVAPRGRGAAPGAALDLSSGHFPHHPDWIGQLLEAYEKGSQLWDADGSDSRPPEALTGLFARYPMRGLWFRETRYAPLRNAAWAVRNSRHGQANNPMALRLVLVEVQRLVDQGELLSDVVEALCELLVHP